MQELVYTIRSNELCYTATAPPTDPCLSAIAQEIRTRNFGDCDTAAVEKLIQAIARPNEMRQLWERQPSSRAKQSLLRVRSFPGLPEAQLSFDCVCLF